MSISLTINSQVCLLLTARFSQRDSTKVLSPTEWGTLCRSMGGAENLDCLLEGRAEAVLRDHVLKEELLQQVLSLLGRGVGLAMASEKWLRSGVWILGAGDPEYPRGLRDLPPERSPPVLFGYGSVEMLEQSAVLIDQRACRADTADLAAAVDAMRVSAVGLLDMRYSREVIRSCLNIGGQVLGVTYKDLVSYGSVAELRQAIMNGSMTIVSSRPPGQNDQRPAVYEETIVYGLSDMALTEQLIRNYNPQESLRDVPPTEQLDFDF